MITRVVKLTLDPQFADHFRKLFKTVNTKIAKQPGCINVRAFENETAGQFFTISTWTSTDDLNNYRHSELFGGVWPTLKLWMIDKPEAWTLNEI